MKRDLYETNYFNPQRWIVYLGSKRKLLNHILSAISDPKPQTVLDLFSGSGIVGSFLKHHGYTVHANDVASYSYVTNKCFLENSKESARQTYPNIDTLIRQINKDRMPSDNMRYFSKYFVKEDIDGTKRFFYTMENALFIDAALAKLHQIQDENLRCILLADLLYSMSAQSNTGGIFVPYKELGSPTKSNYNQIKRPIQICKPTLIEGQQGKAFQSDAIELLKGCQDYDLIYVDPPYNTRQYANYYHILEYACQPLSQRYVPTPDQKCGVDPNSYKSPYSSKIRFRKEFENLFENICNKTKHVVISYGKDGIFPNVELEQMLSKYGKVTRKNIAHRKYDGRGKVYECIFYLKVSKAKK